MSMTTIYKEDSTKESWECILNDMALPLDTDEICIKHISHITETMRQEKKDAQNDNSSRTSKV